MFPTKVTLALPARLATRLPTPTLAMSNKRRRRWRIIRSFSFRWTAAFVFLSVVRGSGTIEQGSVQFEFPSTLVMSALLGVVFGGLAGLVQVWIEERAYKRMPLRRLLALRILFAAASLFTLVLISYAIVSTFFGVSIGLVEFLVEPGSFAIYLFILTTDLFVVMLRQVDLLLGEGNLWRLLRGKFYVPREEERIFMFIDLKSSTTHAEALGHVAYSMLIQDCFDDLGVVADFDAYIYQYLGDGVVLTWPLAEGLKDQNCVNAFFSFRQRLDSRAEYYQGRYQRRPHFTAGAHAGRVMVTEVGRHKKEIAFHGDTINTAARIQGECKSQGSDLLVSLQLSEALGPDRLRRTELGEARLRGREESIALVAVEAPESARPT